MCQASQSVSDLVEMHKAESTYHNSGSHYNLAFFQPICSVLTDCTQKCEVPVVSTYCSDTGETNENFYYHVGREKGESKVNIGPRGSEVSCESAAGCGFSRCLFSDCGFKVSVSISGKGAGASGEMAGGDLWNWAHATGRTCKNGR